LAQLQGCSDRIPNVRLGGPINVRGKNMKKTVYVCFGIVVVTIFVILGVQETYHYCVSMKDNSCFNILNNLILFLTLFVLVIYTIETTKIRKESQKQSVTSIRPVLIPYFPQSGEIAASNEGNGVAINIYILKFDTEKFRFLKESVSPRLCGHREPSLKEFKFTDDKFEILESYSIKQRLPYVSKHIDTILKKNEHTVCLIYSDLDGRKYHTTGYGNSPFETGLLP